MKRNEISRATMGRLPSYLSFIDSLPEDMQRISATSVASALGLGMLYSGFIRRGISNNPEAKSMLGLDADPAMCLLIGYPDVTYLRTVPRKKAHVLWK